MSDVNFKINRHKAAEVCCLFIIFEVYLTLNHGICTLQEPVILYNDKE